MPSMSSEDGKKNNNINNKSPIFLYASWCLFNCKLEKIIYNKLYNK